MGTQVHFDETAFRTELARNGYKKISEFEAASGIPRATIDNMISGRNVPNQRTMQAVYDALPGSDRLTLFSIFFTHGVAYGATIADYGNGGDLNGKAQEA